MTSVGAWAELLRVSALFTVPGDALAGAAATRTAPNRGTALAMGASLCLYEAGMALNDWADRDLDAVERPGRPLPSGRITPAAALTAATGLTGAGLVCAALAGRRTLATAAALAGTVWAYDLGLKNTPAGPYAMATARSLDLLLGATATYAPAARQAVAPAALLGAHTLAVTGVSRHEATGGSSKAPLTALATSAAIAWAATRVPAPATRRRRTPTTTTAPATTSVARGRGFAANGRAASAAAVRSRPGWTGALVRLVAAPGASRSPASHGELPVGGRPALPTPLVAVDRAVAALSPRPGVDLATGGRAGSGAAAGGQPSRSGARARRAASRLPASRGSLPASRPAFRGLASAVVRAAASDRSPANGPRSAGAGRTRPRRAGASGAQPARRLAAAALAATYLATAARPLAHAALNPSPHLLQRAVGGGIRAMIPLQAALASRAGAGRVGVGVLLLMPVARRLSRKVSPT
ncbi:SCO3242 family prenyltransferase [Streptomyces sp. RTd22]|uniref:SCO3242 family prenyltransferase n=1 Tax=Streptomyces sp. RTd22 TaxID=1841249 RepID=UPI000A78108D|nr:UbiA family prenyltransferase [Streptomyces sp. RTd22]